MSLPKYSEILSLSNHDLREEVYKLEAEVFNLRFKKSTRQTFKLHELKHKKRRVSQLRTLVTIRLKEQEARQANGNDPVNLN